jgi:hypothetical protein
LSYLFTINDTPFYAAQAPTWQAYGVQPGFTNDGRPTPYGPGAFSVVLNALAVNDPSSLGGDFATSGTHAQLFAIWQAALSSDNGVLTFHTYDPRSDSYVTVTGRMKPPVQLAGGAAIPGVRIEVYSAFISDVDRAAYYGGDPTPIDTPPDYIPGDPLPPGDPLKNYGWNEGARWNYGLWGQGEGV